MCDACNEQFAVDTWGDGSPAPTLLWCEVCDREESAARPLTLWEGAAMCENCLAAVDSQIAKGACVCLDCLRHEDQHRQDA
jgi:hypothetical protein